MSRLIIVLGLALIPVLFTNCGAGLVMNADGTVDQSNFPKDYESYGGIPSQKVNALPNVNTRFPIQALKAGSGLSPTVTY